MFFLASEFKVLLAGLPSRLLPVVPQLIGYKISLSPQTGICVWLFPFPSEGAITSVRFYRRINPSGDCTSRTEIGELHMGRGMLGSVGMAALGLGATVAIVIAAPSHAATLDSWQFDPNTHQLVITVPKGVTPTHYLVAEPARIVVDLPNTEVGVVPMQQSYSGAVRAVRVAQFQAGLARIVLELSPNAVLAPGQVELQQLDSPDGTTDRWAVRPLFVTDDATNADVTNADVANATDDTNSTIADATPATSPTAPTDAATLEATQPNLTQPNEAESNEALPPLEPGAVEIPIEPALAAAETPEANVPEVDTSEPSAASTANADQTTPASEATEVEEVTETPEESAEEEEAAAAEQPGDIEATEETEEAKEPEATEEAENTEETVTAEEPEAPQESAVARVDVEPQPQPPEPDPARPLAETPSAPTQAAPSSIPPITAVSPPLPVDFSSPPAPLPDPTTPTGTAAALSLPAGSSAVLTPAPAGTVPTPVGTASGSMSFPTPTAEGVAVPSIDTVGTNAAQAEPAANNPPRTNPRPSQPATVRPAPTAANPVAPIPASPQQLPAQTAAVPTPPSPISFGQPIAGQSGQVAGQATPNRAAIPFGQPIPAGQPGAPSRPAIEVIPFGQPLPSSR